MNAQQAIQECTVEGNIIKLPNVQLDRKEYLELKKKLELIGGKWKGGKVQGFVFSVDPSELLKEIAGGKERNLKKEYQYFGTPPELAEELVSYADLRINDTVLEPSCGQGAIIKAINDAGLVPDCFELMDMNVSVLKTKGLKYNLIGSDFLKYNDNYKEYSKIIANPPFAKDQDIIHLQMMYNRYLKSGGRLVCITSASWTFGQRVICDNFKKFLWDLEAEVLDVPRGAFKESGTMVPAKIIIIDKP